MKHAHRKALEERIVTISNTLFDKFRKGNAIDVSWISDEDVLKINILYELATALEKISPKTYFLMDAMKSTHKRFTYNEIADKKTFVFSSDHSNESDLVFIIFADNKQEAWKRLGKKLIILFIPSVALRFVKRN